MTGPADAGSAPEGIALLGEEMLTWSDFGGEIGATRGSLAGLLLGELGRRRARALVVGPHDAGVVLDVAAHADHTDVLVRSYPDAETLRAALPASIGVHCGPLDRFRASSADASYDVVVALDGLDRLHSAEAERPGWELTAGLLGALLAPEGDLLVAVPNAVGLDRLLALDVTSPRADASWPEGRVPGPDERWPGPGVDARVDALAAALDGRSLRVAGRWACFGPRHHPRLAAPVDLVDAHGADPRLVRLATRASDPEDAGSAPVSDPRQAVSSLVAAGLGSRLAPQWVVRLTARADG